MNEIKILEIKSNLNKEYKEFLKIGLINDEENFRITPNDDLNSIFPTKDKQDSFSLGAYFENSLAGIVSFTRDGNDRENYATKEFYSECMYPINSEVKESQKN
jgi:hypothetical protein